MASLVLAAGALACAPLASGAARGEPKAGATLPMRSVESLRVELPTAAGARFRIEDDPDRALAASVYSLPSAWIDTGEARAMLAAVRAADPRRELLVLADEPMASGLAPLVGPGGAGGPRLLVARGGPYSPWPRDPFSFARAPGGAVRVIVRPNLQRGREADAALGPELVRALPPDLDRAWGGVRWARATVPFHNGQVLLTREAAWVSMHTFEPRVLELLGASRVPVERFGDAAGVDAYVAAIRRAGDELAALYDRPVRFVHPLPLAASEPVAVRGAILRRLLGGAGYDLDSLVTLLPAAGERRVTALVADLTLGEHLLAGLPDGEWASFAAAYGLAPQGLAAGLAAASGSDRGHALASYLELVAEHLRNEGLEVARLPLLVVPTALRRAGGELPDEYFFVTWSNVVVERRADGVRAEGFSGLIPTGDRLAREAFAKAGARLDLLPPLLGSVERNGGYRCASNHVRAAG